MEANTPGAVLLLIWQDGIIDAVACRDWGDACEQADRLTIEPGVIDRDASKLDALRRVYGPEAVAGLVNVIPASISPGIGIATGNYVERGREGA